jgi:hypothetical protein
VRPSFTLSANTCNPGGENDDLDGDGFTPKQGDCDDCSPQLFVTRQQGQLPLAWGSQHST